MSSGVTRQPRRRPPPSQAETLLKNIDLAKVRGWNEHDVIQQFLEPIGFAYCSKAFEQQRITGPALVSLTEEHLKELNVMLLGDRVLFLEYLVILKKKKNQQERSNSLWTGTTPHVSCAYSSNPCQYLFRVCCPCCVAKTTWSVTSQGLRSSAYPSSINLVGKTVRDFIDFRFLKDLEIHSKPTCLCCCRGYDLLIYADDPSENSTKHGEPTRISHPEALQIEKAIRDAWAEARLVD